MAGCQELKSLLDELPKAIDEVEKLLTRNRIFLDRTEGIGDNFQGGCTCLRFDWTEPSSSRVLIWICVRITLTRVMKSMILMCLSEQG